MRKIKFEEVWGELKAKYCSQKQSGKFFFFISRLFAELQFLKTVIFWLKFFLSFQKHVLDQTSKAFSTKFGPQREDRKSSYQVNQFLSLLCNVVTLISD